MNGLCPLPRVGQLLIRTGANITSNQGIHGFGCYFSRCLAGTGDLSHLSIENTLFVGIYFESSKHIDLFDQ